MVNIKYEIPNWLATRTYFFGKEESRTYITNEKMHTNIQLDGVASDFWYLLVSKNIDELDGFIKLNQLEEQVEPFLVELYGQGLVLLDNVEKKDSEENKDNCQDFGDEKNDQFVIEKNNWLFKNGFMGSLMLELTYRCNLKCIHCYNPKDMATIEIDYDKAIEIINQAYELGCYSVTLTGGESTTHTRFIDIARYIRNKKMALYIFTNGQKLAKENVLFDELISLYPHQVCLSLYSDKKNTHDKVTDVDGSFDKTKEIIEKLRNKDVSVQIKNFLLNFACKDCVAVRSYGDSIGASTVADLSLIPTIDGDKKTHNYAMTEEQLFELYSNQESPLYLGENPALFDYKENKDYSPCLGGFNGLTISPKLDVNICVSLPKPVGNLKSVSLSEIWNGAMNRDKTNLLYQWLIIKNSDLTECYKEEYCKFCHYCAGMGYLENGYLKKSDIQCKQAKAKLKAYNYLKSKGIIKNN